MSDAPVRVFVAADGNAFMTDVARNITEACALAGRDALLVTDRLPARDGSLQLVVAPHELFALSDAPVDELRRAAAASVCIGTEQPGTTWFERSLDAIRLGPTALDINEDGVAALRAEGVNAHRLVLGTVPSMVAPATARDIDVLFLGALDERRSQVLAALAPRLARHRSELRCFVNDRPVGIHTPGLVFGAAKHRLLARAKVLVNLHRDRGDEVSTYFEWARLTEAMANGCVVLTEPATGHEPLVDGVHFVSAPLDELGDALDRLLDDEDRRCAIASSASDAVSGPLSLASSMRELLPVLDRAARDTGHAPAGPWRLRPEPRHAATPLPVFEPFLPLQRAAKRLARAEDAALRRLDAAQCRLRHGSAQHIERHETPAYAAATPEVTVAVSLYDYAGVVGDALDSVVASTGIDLEIVVVDDHATDASRAVVQQYLVDHPNVPMLLLGKDANEGLVAARNTAFEHARAELVMVLDADNQLAPRCLRRLADTLAAHPDADASYSILEDFGSSTGLRSALAWDVERLCAANYVDAQAMLRRSSWERLGGYGPADDEIYGWEDWDLWLRIAERGGCAVLCPEILGRYRTQPSSMVALSNVAGGDAIAAMRARHPSLPWPA